MLDHLHLTSPSDGCLGNAPHESRPQRVANSYLATDFHRLFFASLPGALNIPVIL